MPWPFSVDADKLLLAGLLLARMAGLTMTAPGLGLKGAPVPVRPLLALALAAVLLPTQWDLPVGPSGGLAAYALSLGCEGLIGACLGLGVAVLLSGMLAAGELIGRCSGAAMADSFDPTLETDAPLSSRLLSWIGLVAFLGMGGHRAMMAGLMDTFAAVPLGLGLKGMLEAGPGEGGLLRAMAETIVLLVGQSFQLGVRASAPVVVAMLLANVALGLIGRTLPQLNTMMLGLNVNALLALGVLLVSLGAAAWAFQQQVEPTLEMLLDTFKIPLRSQWLT